VEGDRFPAPGVGTAVEHTLVPVTSRHELERGRALRTERAFRDGGIRIAFDVGDLVVLYVHELAAADAAVGTDRLHRAIGLFRPRTQRAGSIGPRGLPER